MTETTRAESAEETAEAARPATRLGEVTTTTLVHRRSRGAVPWWRDAVVYRVPGPVDEAGLLALAKEVSHVARLGANAVQVRVPDVDPRTESGGAAVDELVRRVGQRNLRLIAGVTGDDAPDDVVDRAAWHLDRVTAWLDRGADGVDLQGAGVPEGPGPHEHAGVDIGALHALVAEREERIITGAVSSVDPEDVAAHLHEDWLHISRDDRLARVAWRADELRATISDAYLQRDAVGAPAGWTLSRVTGHTEATDAGPQAWDAPTPAALRRRLHAATLLMIALPGVVYLRQGEAVDMVPGGVDPATTVEHVSREAAQQRGRAGSLFERYRHALRLRRELGLGTGHLAWVDDPPGTDTLAFISSKVLVLVNLGGDDLYVPADRDLLHASEDLPMPLDETVIVPPDTTVWIALE
ncbi:alpha-amylase family protein [Georgenia subflava]|uniref:DUF3459 domain-containing protein n=1 Tax=Georgenia subflava TaxID=1622177 RepID=A0A6N7ELJ5_9MICO|nr:hypothetical protein [Georgenia subflava]MPV37943.1 hypothetical protein [Georgenia subflava]